MKFTPAKMCRRSLVLAAGLSFFSVLALAGEPGESLSSTPESIDWAVTTGTVPFDITLDKPSVLARVNGSGPYLFLLDTGVSGATLDDNIVRQASVKSRTAGSSEIGHIGELNIGGVILKGVDVAVYDWDLAEHGYRRFDGTLGLSVFKDCLLTLDYPNLKMSLTQGHLAPADGLQILDYKEVNGLAAIPLGFGKTKVNMLIDTGSVEAIMINKSLRDKIALAGPAESSAGSEPVPARGNVRLGGFGFVEPPTRFHDQQSAIGQLALYHFSFTLDQKNRRVRFLRKHDAYITFGGHSKFGLIVERQGKALRIVHIVPGTPACRRGLRIGDILEGINRQYSEDYDEQALQRLFDESDRLLLHVGREGHRLIFKIDAE